MKPSKISFKTLLIILFIAALAITYFNVEKNKKLKSSNVITNINTPLGQASVVDNISDPNILQVAMGSKDHATLVAAVQAAHIEHVLVNAGPLTVFAPTDTAFSALAEGTVENLLKPENVQTLATILTQHAAPGTYDIAKLKKEANKKRKLYMATGDYLEITIQGEDVFVNDCKVLVSIPTVNGIINVIDKVILL